ncbi:nuclear transport factor 2 family protein [Anditalea andensis]|uniref:SnoaL-like domain-containing protein n=1 Tax=Anditalea andensis TaxID=1048983 RepID=A0A074LG75_9BACT|nr:nuclear transport factor 2 family protein [Anditalea andensis]KEO72797.1 hypothetical protein EL17_14285 [Anditalea andensis]
MVKKLIVGTFLLFSILPLYAQQLQDKNEIQQVISNLFQGMRDKDQQLIEKSFHSEAVMHTAAQSPDGTKLGSNSVNEFINRVAVTPPETILDERIQDYHIQVDGDIASAWTPYRFYVNDGFSHCGVNSFQFIRIDGQWKITYVIDTRRKDNCN